MRIVLSAACVLAFLHPPIAFSASPTLTRVDVAATEPLVAAVPCTNGSVAIASRSVVARVTSSTVIAGPTTLPDQAVGIARCTESETIVVGKIDNRNAPRTTWLARVSRDGKVMRTFELEGGVRGLPKVVVPVADGAFIAGNAIEDAPNTEKGFYWEGIFVLRIDAETNIRWIVKINTPAREFVVGITPQEDGGAIILGQHDQASFWAARIDRNGMVSWSRAYRLAASMITASVPAGNGATIIVGSTGVAEDVTPHISVTKLTADGEVVWSRAFTTPGLVIPDSVHPRRGGYLVAGHLAVAEKRDVVLLDIDENGQPAKQCIFAPPGGRLTWESPVVQARGSEGHVIAFGTADGFAYVTAPDDTVSLPSPCISCGDGLTEIDGIRAMPRPATPVVIPKAARWVAGDDYRPATRGEISDSCRGAAQAATKSVPRAAPAPPIELDSGKIAERLNCRELGRSAGALLAARRYDDLDAIALRIRGKNARNRDGSWKVPCLYVGLQRKNEALRELSNADYDKLLTDWIDRGPKSATPWVALAWEMWDRGRRLSGDRDPDTMTERGSVILHEYLGKSRRLLDAVPPNVPRDVYFYRLELELAYRYFGNGNQVFHAALRFEPEYEEFYEYAFGFNSDLADPWRPGDFIRDSVKLTTERSADWIYAMLAKQAGFASMSEAGLSWARVRKGYESHLAQYPDDARARRDFASLACEMKERSLARAQFERPELTAEALLREVGVDYLEQCRTWAMQAMAAVPTPAHVARVPSPPGGPATPWVDGSFETWPRIAMPTEVDREGKPRFRAVSTFLVNVDGTTVAVSTANIDPPDDASRNRPLPGTWPPAAEAALHKLTRELKAWRVAPSDASSQMSLLGAIWPARDPILMTQGVLFSVADGSTGGTAALEWRRKPLPVGAEVYVVARPAGARSQVVIAAHVTGRHGDGFGQCHLALKGDADPASLLGAAVIDDAGFVAGVVTNYSHGSKSGGMVGAEEIGLLLGANAETKQEAPATEAAAPAAPKASPLASGSWALQPISTWPAIALSTEVVRSDKPAFTKVTTFLLDIDGTRVAVSGADLNLTRKPPTPGVPRKIDPHAKPPRVALQFEMVEWRVAAPAAPKNAVALKEFWSPAAGLGGNLGIMLRVPDGADLNVMPLKPRPKPITAERTPGWLVYVPPGSRTQKVVPVSLEHRLRAPGARYGMWWPQIMEPVEVTELLGGAIIDEEGYAVAVVASVLPGAGAGSVNAEEIGLLLGLEEKGK